MSLIIATGTNQGDKSSHLKEAIKALSCEFIFIQASNIYHSKAVDYEAQPDFYNQVLEFELPLDKSPDEVMDILLNIERKLGRIRDPRMSYKGPRKIDLDILFFGLIKNKGPKTIIPHPRLFERSFVVLPLIELPYYSILKENFEFNLSFKNQSEILYSHS